MSGSSGNAIYIETTKTKVLVDAGQSGKRVAQALLDGCGIVPGDLDGILVTHAHRDHICGVGVLCRRYKLPVYATEGTWFEMEPLIGPVPFECRKMLEVGGKLEIKDLQAETFPTSHDAMEPVGLVCQKKGKGLGIATDSGVFTSRMSAMLKGLDCLILEANHDTEMLHTGPYPWPLKKRIASVWGHLSNEAAAQALLKTIGDDTKNIVLSHLSQENNRPHLALETVRNTLKNNSVCLEDVEISIAPRYCPGPLVSI